MTIKDILLPYQAQFMTAPEHRKLWISGRQLGKSTTMAVCLARAALAKKNGLSLCVSVNSRSASEIVRKCQTVADAVYKLTKGQITYTAGFDHVNFSNGSRIMSLPSTSDSLRGFTAQCVCIDEAAYIANLDDVLQAIGPTLTRQPDADLILASTPAGKNGPFYDLWRRAQEDEAWYAQTTTVHDAIRMGLKVDLDALHTLCPDPDVFAQEYECIFQSEHGAWLDPEALLFEDFSDLPGDSWLGLDVGVKNDATGLVIAKQRGNQLVFEHLEYMRKTNFEDQFQHVRSLQTQKQISAGYVDAVGIGYGLSERIQREINWKIKPFTWTGANKTPAYEAFKADVLQKKIVFNRSFEQMVKDDIRMVSKVVTPDGHVKYTSERSSLGHGDIASALVLCHQAWRSMPQNMSMPTAVPMFSVF